MIIKGKKIYLKKGLSNKLYSAMLKWFTDIEVMRYVSFVKTMVNMKGIEDVKLFCKDAKNAIFFGIYLNKLNKLIGYSVIGDIKNKQGEFGIIIGEKDYWGKGVGAEATKLMVDYSFNQIGLERIYLTTSEYNKNAIRLYKKFGFEITKKIPNDREVFHNNKWLKSATVCMEIKKQDYANR